MSLNQEIETASKEFYGAGRPNLQWQSFKCSTVGFKLVPVMVVERSVCLLSNPIIWVWITLMAKNLLSKYCLKGTKTSEKEARNRLFFHCQSEKLESHKLWSESLYKMGQRIEKPNFVRNEAMQIFGLNFIFYATRESPRGGVVFSLGVVRYKMDLKIEFCGFKKIFAVALKTLYLPA